MLKSRLTVLWIILIAGAIRQDCFSQVKASAITGKIDTLIRLLYSRQQFNGAILVSRNGKIVYTKALGKADEKNNIDFDLSTPCYLASLSKQFTAIGILILVQKKLLLLEDHISKFFPDFPHGDSITVKQLLNHTSGIVNYEELGIDRPGLTNQDVYNSLVQHKTLQFSPGEKYDYSNSGYVLAAEIIEKVSKMSFAEFMTMYVFDPLGLTNTYIYTKSSPVSKAYGKFGEESDAISSTTGDGGICSSAEDLLKWDKALYTSKLVSQQILSQAFAPATLNNGSKILYGLGWMLKKDSVKIVYHTGGSGGYRTYIERDLKNHNSIIILNNIENSPRREISVAIENILNDKPWELPKIAIAPKMYAIWNNHGIDSAIQFYNYVKKNSSAIYDFSEQELNLLGYKFLSLNKMGEAIKTFNLNTITYPGSSNAFESLGEAYLKNGDKDKAEVCFKESLNLDEANQDAIRMLKQLK